MYTFTIVVHIAKVYIILLPPFSLRQTYKFEFVFLLQIRLKER